MYSLILDSSNVELIVGLANDDVKIAEIRYDAWQRQSEFMIQEISNILKRANISPKEIGEVITTIGPGSYTGVRISLTIAKVYAYALKIPLYLESSLEILKDGNNDCLCVMNARGARSYVGRYADGKTLIADSVLKNDEVIELSKNENIEICGDIGYLGLESKKTDIVSNMIEIKKNIQPVDNVLAVKPVYLKD